MPKPSKQWFENHARGLENTGRDLLFRPKVQAWKIPDVFPVPKKMGMPFGDSLLFSPQLVGSMGTDWNGLAKDPKMEFFPKLN